jgi:hypothetical protein
MSTTARFVILGLASSLIFVVVVTIGLRFMPEPRTETDYLVVGSIATLVSLAAVFGVLITTWVKTPDVFFKKRSK